MRHFGDWIKERRKALGMQRQIDLVVKSGLSPNVINRLETSETSEGRNRGTLRLLATALGCTVEELERVASDERFEPPLRPPGLLEARDHLREEISRHVADSKELRRKGISVHGDVTGSDVRPSFNSRHSEGGNRIPLYLEDYPDAFALRVTGHSMSPLYNNNDFVIVSPAKLQSIPPNAECYVQMHDGDAAFKRVVPMGDGTIMLLPINQEHQPIMTDAERIAAVYRAIGKFTLYAQSR